ncbi:biotin--[acetyl-CoA-carboxylase] ligase [Rubrivivax rivuli]|uniref:biotin--[biotin carboxyl-carrier protein] ligase n=1 Tax=Rubrivivax rivuli TaxID=1862385 RepID=A0A437RQV1_9BURK|nr:biotin--[acetyl-CoA-carboxylase] ligase [Rubrivivax rivuli]RVU49051.1 biotin--[acetyl-CoA-carboxylase] ligase [Rubrivivax rivuli]
MPNSQTQWGAEALWQQLEPLLPGLSVEVLARAESTNTLLLDRARAWAGAPDGLVTRPGELDGRSADRERPTPLGRRGADIQPCLLVAEQQTRGRGRLGRDWVSSAGASLTFSLALPLAPADWSGLSLAVGLALAEALDPLPAEAPTSPRLMLKWPNDLWLAEGPAQPGQASGSLGRKLGGILIETVNVGHRRLCVVGVGLNVRPQAVPELPHGYACLAEMQAEASAPATLAAVALPLVRALLRFEAEGFAPLQGAYARRDLLQGQPVTTTLAAVPEGVAEGVDERGALRVRSGDLHSLVSGEVSVRLQGGGA